MVIEHYVRSNLSRSCTGRTRLICSTLYFTYDSSIFSIYFQEPLISEINQKNGTKTITVNRTNVILNTVFFVLGFSVVFSALGVIINSTLGGLSNELISGFQPSGRSNNYWVWDLFVVNNKNFQN